MRQAIVLFLALLVVWSAAGETLLPTQGYWSYQNGQGAYAEREGAFVRIGNGDLERVIRLSDGTASTIQYINKRSGRGPGSQQGAEFTIRSHGAVAGELSAPDFALQSITVDDKADPMSVVLAYAGKAYPAMTVAVTYETHGGVPFQRKWLLVNWKGEGDVTVDRIDVESTGGFGWWFEGKPSHEGMGQPLFVADMYLGLEYPGAEVTNEYLRHFPGKSALRGLRSKTAVWGVARGPDSVREAFFGEYLSTLATLAPKPFVIWNLIGTGTPESSLLVREVQSLAARAAQSSLTIESYAVDDVWQDYTSIWKPDPIRFPRGFAPVVQVCESAGSHLGLWVTLDGVGLDTRWGKARGLEVTQVGYRGPTGGRYCIAGPQYKAELKRVLEGYLRESKVNYFKIDYNAFGCDDTTHGHGDGPAGREAQIDAFIEVLDSIKKVSPDCRTALTTGMWLSPWWVPHADYIWLGGNDMGEMKDVKSLTPQDSAITYRDAVLYEDFVEKHYAFPFARLMTHGFWEIGAAPYDKFQDDVVMTIGRGISKYEVLNAPASLDDKRFRFLSRAIKWGISNWDILADTRMVFGDPRKGEVYGYAHVGEAAALVFLRNPGIESKEVGLELAKAGIGRDFTPLKYGRLKAHEVYPAEIELDWDGNALAPVSIHVLGSQTKVVAIAGATMPDRLRLK